MAIKYHPDKNYNDSSAKRKFQELTEAYNILINPDKRNLYEMRKYYTTYDNIILEINRIYRFKN